MLGQPGPTCSRFVVGDGVIVLPNQDTVIFMEPAVRSTQTVFHVWAQDAM